MPSAVTPCASDALAITTLWPMAVAAIVPVCLRVMVNFLHEAGTVIEPTLYCIASVPSIVVAQSLTVAAGFSPPVAAAAGAAVDVAAGTAADVAAGGAVVAAAGIAVVAAGAGAAA